MKVVDAAGGAAAPESEASRPLRKLGMETGIEEACRGEWVTRSAEGWTDVD